MSLAGSASAIGGVSNGVERAPRTSREGGGGEDLSGALGWGRCRGEGGGGGGGGGFHDDRSEKRGEAVGIEGHPRRKGTKGHVGVNRRGLPLGVEWGPGNEQGFAGRDAASAAGEGEAEEAAPGGRGGGGR